MSNFIHFGCWNNLNKGCLKNVMNLLNNRLEDINKPNIDFLTVAGDNYYTIKESDDGEKKKIIIPEKLNLGFEYLPQDIDIYMILGNHEQYFLSPVRIQSEITLVKEFFCFCINDFKHFETLKLFKKTVEINDWTFKHTINNLKIYKNTEINITKNTSIGHSHQQYLRRINSKFLLNPGSVGQNRGNIKFANYAILNFDHGSFKLKSIEYEYQKFLKQIVSLNYSNNCKRYYTSKI